MLSACSSARCSPLTAMLALVLLLVCCLCSVDARSRRTTTSSAPSPTRSTARPQTPSASARAALSSYRNFVTIYLENQSFNYLFGSYPGANGIPKALLSYQPQVDFSGRPLPSLPPCSNTNPASCLFPPHLPNRPFEGSTYIPLNSSTPFDITHAYYNEQFQLHDGRGDRYATPTTDGYPQVSTGGAWTMAYYNLTSSYLFQLASNFTLLDNHFHPAFGNSYANHLFLISGRLPLFNNSVEGCATQPDYVTKVDDSGSAFFKGNVINRCTPDGKIFSTTYPPNWPPASYDPTSPTVKQGLVISGPVPSTPVPHSPRLDFVMPMVLDTRTLGDELDDAGHSWCWYAQSYDAVLSANFSAAAGFAYHHHPFTYFHKMANLSSDYARAHQADDSRFFQKLAAGTLEEVAFVKPSDVDSFHPSSSNIGDSSPYLQRVMDAIFASPQYQAGTMLVMISFDENGGLWDHVPPYKGDADGPATRIPGILISPHHAGGRINSMPYDDMGWAQMIERRFNLSSSIVSPQRAAVTRDYTNTFDDPTRAARWSFHPEHVRATAVTAASARVEWETLDALLPMGTQPRVMWGRSPQAMTEVAVGNSTLGAEAAWVEHRVEVAGLDSNSTYFYHVLHQDVKRVPYYTLTTAPQHVVEHRWMEA